ncbi:hypothetical protein RHSIM_Rhsim13G0139200 [Rhododendron simsii]|uniref:Uncharacterized protein n=1 Tax=Rhododendron simsii TaxID=118357 RepID=A0A834L7G0_RHOSS|nr:hypothetical protein RHSIM_Rhsim13G0139200 [Rhododendron simsii]
MILALLQNQNQPPPPPPIVNVDLNVPPVIPLENPPPPPAPEPVINEVQVRDFQKLKPLIFHGGIDPIKANEWLDSIEKIFQVMTCTDRKKVALATYNLIEEENNKRIRELKKRRYANSNPRVNNGPPKRQNVGNPNRGNQNQKQNRGGLRSNCPTCGINHLGVCLEGTGVFYSCGEARHIRKNCTELQTNLVAVQGNGNQRGNANARHNNSNQRQTINAGQRQGRTYALVPGNTQESENVVAGEPITCVAKQMAAINAIGTAEIPVVGIHMDSILTESALTLKYVAYSHCFRTEVGVAGTTRISKQIHADAYKIQLYNDLMKYFREDLHRRLLSTDFKMQVEAIEMLHKVLKFLPELFDMLRIDWYTLTKSEAAIFVPCLVEKVIATLPRANLLPLLLVDASLDTILRKYEKKCEN